MLGMGGGDQGDMVVGDGESMRRVVAAPAEAGQEAFRPGVQVTMGLVVIPSLVSADEASGDADATTGLHEHYGHVATGATPGLEGGGGCLDAGFNAANECDAGVKVRTQAAEEGQAVSI